MKSSETQRESTTGRKFSWYSHSRKSIQAVQRERVGKRNRTTFCKCTVSVQGKKSFRSQKHISWHFTTFLFVFISTFVAANFDFHIRSSGLSASGSQLTSRPLFSSRRWLSSFVRLLWQNAVTLCVQLLYWPVQTLFCQNNESVTYLNAGDRFLEFFVWFLLFLQLLQPLNQHLRENRREFFGKTCILRWFFLRSLQEDQKALNKYKNIKGTQLCGNNLFRLLFLFGSNAIRSISYHWGASLQNAFTLMFGWCARCGSSNPYGRRDFLALHITTSYVKLHPFLNTAQTLHWYFTNKCRTHLIPLITSDHSELSISPSLVHHMNTNI